MKILHVIVAFNPELGGPVNSCYLISKNLVRRGHDVTIICSDYKFDTKYAESIKEVNIIPFRSIFRIGLFIITPGMNIWLKKNIKKFDVIHLHEFQSYQNSVVFCIANKNKVRYVLQARGLAPEIMSESFLKNLYNFVWGYRILKFASKNIALTEREFEEYIEMGVPKNKIVIIPNGINLEDYNDLPEKGDFKLRYGIKDNQKIILYLGRLHEIKGLDLLIESFHYLLKSYNECVLVFVGPDDGYLSNLKKAVFILGIEEKIIFTGPLYGNDKLLSYVNSDVFVLPSKYEVFGNTILEAWACGVPVVVTDTCSLANIIENAGIVVKSNKNDLRDAIYKLLIDEKFRIACINEGKRVLKTDYDINKVSERIELLYKSIIGGENENRNTDH